MEYMPYKPIISPNLTPDQLQWIEAKWLDLAKAIKLSATETDEYYRKILSYYEEPHRAYHNSSHIYSLLQLSEILSEHIEDPVAIQIIIWWHDIIYQPSRKDNELKSAKLAVEMLKNKLDPTQLDYIFQVIESTAKHIPSTSAKDNLLFLDMDLSILASEQSVYTTYTKAIRKEYKLYPNFLYKPGRRKILKRFLDREAIYYTALGKKQWEAKARENIIWELNKA